MDARLELARERGALVKADADLRQGARRIAAQGELIAALRSKGLDVAEAERLRQLLCETQRHWQDHRALIVDRVAYLEAKLGAAASDGEPRDR